MYIYIVRDQRGQLWLYEYEPFRSKYTPGTWNCNYGQYMRIHDSTGEFDCITWSSKPKKIKLSYD